MDKLSDLIPRVLSRRGLKDQAVASHVTYQASLWISENLSGLAEQIHVQKLQDRVLHIACDHPIAAQELSQHIEALKIHLRAFDDHSALDIVISRSL